MSIAILVLQTHQLLGGSGQALARPLKPNTADDASKASKILDTQRRATISDPDETGQSPITPEAVLKALQALANNIQSQEDGQTSSPIVVLSHGDGGPIKHKDDGQGSTDISGTGSKKSHKDDAPVKTKDNKDKDAAKAAMQNLQHPRTRFCAQAANTNRTIDDISQTLVKKERKRLAAIRKQRSSMPPTRDSSTEPRSLTDAKILAEQTKTVQVVWHVIHSGSSGNISDDMINDQIQTLNSDYKDFGFAFDLNTTNRVENARWFKDISPDTNLQDQMKSSLRQGDAKVLNLYSVDFQNGLLGYAAFPWDVESNLTNDGVVFQYSTVPGGSETGYNLGKTATHEVGHWLGLYHVFQGGCSSPGDYVDDTPPQSVATSGCPTGQDSCTGGGVDSIHNYME